MEDESSLNGSAWGDEDQELEEEESSYDVPHITPLRLIKSKKVIHASRPPILASIFERIAFYQFQVNSASKSQFTGSNPNYVSNWMLLALCANMTLGVLGTYYVIVFLGIYAKEQHLVISKMVPLAFGIDIIFFFCAILDLTRFTDLSVTFLDYLILGLFDRSPWNRCESFESVSTQQEINGKQYSFQCLNFKDFRDYILANQTGYHFARFGDYSCYIMTGTDKCVQVVQTAYIEEHINDNQHSMVNNVFFAIVLWSVCVICSFQIYQRVVWKLMLYADVLLCILYFGAAVHVTVFPDDTEIIYASEMRADYYHVIIWIDPGLESLGMSVSTVGHTLFFIVTNFKVRTYVFSQLGGLSAGAQFTSAAGYMNLDYWLIYFESLPPGNFISLLFLFFNFLGEYVSMMLTFSCTVEIYNSEIQFVRRWMVMAVIVVSTISLYISVTEERYILQFFGRLSIMILESTMIYFFYPLSRLLDDMYFHFGEQVSYTRYLSIIFSVTMEILLSSVAVVYIRIDKIVSYISKSEFQYSFINSMLIGMFGLPFVGGAVWTCFKFVAVQRKHWTSVLIPLEDWGPSDWVTRQLRKQFSSHKYISSQAPKVLSRYLMKNAEPETYKIDIVYDFGSLWRRIRDKSVSHPSTPSKSSIKIY